MNGFILFFVECIFFVKKDKNCSNLYSNDIKYRFVGSLSRFCLLINLLYLPPSKNIYRVTIPEFLRAPIFGLYVRAYNCEMREANDESLSAYPTFTAFFNRQLKARVRPISASLLVCNFSLIPKLWCRSLYNCISCTLQYTVTTTSFYATICSKIVVGRMIALG